MANDTVKSTSLTNLDATPFLMSNGGQGAVSIAGTVEDYCAATAAGLQSVGSYYKLLRVPTFALVKSLTLFTDKAPDAASAKTVAFDLSWVFSDSTDDGTPTYLQGLIPTLANTGGTVSIATYTGVNKMYGTFIETSNTAAYGPTDLVFNGLGSNYSFTGGFMNLPLWQIFGFTDGRGYPADPGGFFDLLAYVATGATTGQACNIFARANYAVF
jgi:hypothetical protein